MTFVGSLRLTMSSQPIASAGGRVPRGTGVMCTSQGLLSKAHDEPLYVLNHAYDGLRCGAPRGTVRVPDDSLFGKTIQPAPSHIEYVPPAHSCVKETSHLCRGRSWLSHALQPWVSDGRNPVGYKTSAMRIGHRGPSVCRMQSHIPTPHLCLY